MVVLHTVVVIFVFELLYVSYFDWLYMRLNFSTKAEYILRYYIADFGLYFTYTLYTT